MSLLNERYFVPEFNKIIISYKILDGDQYNQLVRVVKGTEEVRYETKLSNEVPANLPLNTDYYNWGITSFMADSKMLIKDISSKLADSDLYLTFYNKLNTLIEVVLKDSKQIVGKITDKIISEGSNEFIRRVNYKNYYIKNGVVYFIYEQLFAHKYISKLTPSKTKPGQAMTLDIETYQDTNGLMHIYCISFYDGKDIFSFYIADFKHIEDLLNKMFSVIFSPKYRNRIIYIHNSSNFDLIFLLKHISNIGYVGLDSIIKDGKFINLTVTFGKQGQYQIIFRDSMLLLPNSLAKLSEVFCENHFKEIFPYDFVNEQNLNYVGPVPAYKYFDPSKVSPIEYSEYVNKFPNNIWDLKLESIKYCQLDCKSLAEAIDNFGLNIFNSFEVDIDKCPTLPSVAFRIFRTKFLADGVKIPILSDQIYNKISNAYYGGHTNLFIPCNFDGRKLYSYDVNSLYPSQMESQLMPFNIIAYFKGNILNMHEYVDILFFYIN